LAGLAYRAGAATFNRVLGTHLAEQGYVCRIGVDETLAAAGTTLVIALLAATAAGIRASRIDPAQSLREGR
jgi:putative ABC transport system permease protein